MRNARTNSARTVREQRTALLKDHDHFPGNLLELARREPVLSREEERDLIRRYKEEEDRDASDRLILSHLRLVLKVSAQYAGSSGNHFMDLVQQGNLGMIMALNKYDPSKKARFCTYALFWIRASILQYIRDNHSLVKVSGGRMENRIFFSLNKARQELKQKGLDPDDHDRLAGMLHADRDRLKEFSRTVNQRMLSLDQGALPDSTAASPHLLHDRSSDLEKQVLKKDLDERLERALRNFERKLNRKERVIWKSHILPEKKESFDALGAQFGVCGERIRQIESRIKNRLKEYLTTEEKLRIEDYTDV